VRAAAGVYRDGLILCENRGALACDSVSVACLFHG